MNDYFSKYNPEEMQEIERKYIEYFENLHKEFLEKVKKERQITDETEAELKKIIGSFIEAN